MKKTALTTALSLTLFLAACGQQPRTTPINATTTQTNTEATITTSPTDLTTTTPGGQTIQGQVLNKSVPIVLFHGLAGWGRDELLGYKYWGGLTDVEADLRAQGYKVYTVSMGPVSSNWDRAAEAYAQIKGGCVDYGPAHSTKYGHTRHDPTKCYPGLYPEWDSAHPINAIGHSMGGQTVRLLARLLESGNPADSDSNNLFAGGRGNWIKGIMTVSSPNSGSPATDSLQNAIPMFKDMILKVAELAGLAGDAAIYNFDLGQWGLTRQSGEGFLAYQNRVFNSRIWTTNDQAAYDLSTEGAAEQNAFTGRNPNVIYTSWSTSASNRGLITGWHYPDPTMMPVMQPIAYPYAWPLKPGLGNINGTSPNGKIKYDSSWWENDGLVPVKSMTAPIGQNTQTYTGQTLIKGQWYNLGKLNTWDHTDIVGHITIGDVKPFYRNQAAFLSNLP